MTAPLSTNCFRKSSSPWSLAAAILEIVSQSSQGPEQFARSGSKLVRLEFPKTEIQCYGYTAIIYTTYLYELEKDGRRSVNSGRATEMFVNRNGQWVNPGWHMDTVK